jgi:hypothetical protein
MLSPPPPSPLGHSVIQLAPIQKPVLDVILPVDEAVPFTSKLLVVGTWPMPNLKSVVAPKFIVLAPILRSFKVAVSFEESILNNDVPAALVILN